MGFYLRKSVKLGPIRLNLSKSGIGASVGVRGLRYGIRPDGRAYLHAGRGGIYYRTTFGGRADGRGQPSSSPSVCTAQTSGPTTVYETADASELTNLANAGLPKLLNESYGWVRLDYFCAIVSLVFSVVALVVSASLSAFVAVVGFFGTLWLCWWEIRRRTVYVNYDLPAAELSAFQCAVDAVNSLGSCSAVWLLDSSTSISGIRDFKAHAGASELVTRRRASVGTGIPPWANVNVTIPTILARQQTLYFLPDGVLVYDATGVGHIEYTDLSVQIGTTRFIEQSPPSDASIVDYTWLHPNKGGGPDRRHSYNPQIPVCLYGDMTLSTRSGMLLCFHTSSNSTPEYFRSALCRLTSASQSSLGAHIHPTIEVNAEHFESLGSHIARTARASGPAMLDTIAAADILLRRVAGEGNVILHNFLRFLSASSVLLLGVGMLFVAACAVRNLVGRESPQQHPRTAQQTIHTVGQIPRQTAHSAGSRSARPVAANINEQTHGNKGDETQSTTNLPIGTHLIDDVAGPAAQSDLQPKETQRYLVAYEEANGLLEEIDAFRRTNASPAMWTAFLQTTGEDSRRITAPLENSAPLSAGQMILAADPANVAIKANPHNAANSDVDYMHARQIAKNYLTAAKSLIDQGQVPADAPSNSSAGSASSRRAVEDPVSPVDQLKRESRDRDNRGFRTWRDKSGQFAIQAEFQGCSEETVTLRRTDGTTVDVPFERLSGSDQEWIRQRELR